MIIARSNWQLRRALDSLTLKACSGPIEDVIRERPRVAFIPTMGALHEGHISLMKAAREDGTPITVASVFVNPTQFAPGEDFERYPRTEESDLALLDEAQVDVAFLPSVDDIYPADFGTEVKADRHLTSCLCGSSRGAEHFDGVVTVVARLFGLVQPDTAWFGEKDWQQLQVIRRMARDIHPGVEVLGAPTIRAKDGLALSSRNRYLSQPEREAATAIPTAMNAVKSALTRGESLDGSLSQGREILERAGFEVEYLEARNARSLTVLNQAELAGPESPDHPRLFVAARINGVRLIDNDAVFNQIIDNPRMAVTAA